MDRIHIPKAEFAERIARIQHALKARGLDGMMVWGDEYRKENLRYVCNCWPLFERAACFIPLRGEPVVASMAEGERTMRELSAWSQIRNVREFAAVTVPEEIDYPNSTFTPLAEVVRHAIGSGKRLGLVGLMDLPVPIHRRIQDSVPGLEIIDCADILIEMRMIKSEHEIACLREAGRIACVGYQAMLASCVPGVTELHAAGAAEGAARQAGAESIIFHVFGSGERADTVIPRPRYRLIQDGDMIMSSLAVQYEGYVATAEFPFVAGTPRPEQRDFLQTLFEAANVQYAFLKDGAISGEMVRAVQAVFAKRGWGRYDLYPPMHGCGLAEAESPYPNAKTTYALRSGHCVNSDISLFGHPAGSNRIEEGFVIRREGPESLTPLIRRLCVEGRVSSTELAREFGSAKPTAARAAR